MHLYKNREIAFYHLLETQVPQNIFAARQAEREDLSYIDQASAVLSIGGGKAYSVKSSVLSKTSIMTPPTNLSVASSAFRSRASDKEYSTAPSMVSKNSRASSHQSRTIKRNQDLKKKNPIELLTVGGSLTARPCNIQSERKEPIQRSQSIPFPYLQGFLDKAAGTRPAKRVIFDHSDYDDLLGKIQGQIEFKQTQKFEEKQRQSEWDAQLLESWRQRLYEEQQNQMRDRNLKQKAFFDANEVLRQQKHEIKQAAKDEKTLERINYFPFTHGDLIEKQRSVLAELQAHELNKSIRERKEIREADARARKQAILNQIANTKMASIPNYNVEPMLIVG